MDIPDSPKCSYSVERLTMWAKHSGSQALPFPVHVNGIALWSCVDLASPEHGQRESYCGIVRYNTFCDIFE